MKIVHYLLGASMLFSGIDLIFTTAGSLYACPRCRRALPKGPRKHPHPVFPSRHTKPSVPAIIANATAVQLPSACSSCCCAQQKTSSIRPSQKKHEESLHEQK